MGSGDEGGVQQAARRPTSACKHSPMPRVSDAFLAELGLRRADHPVHECGDDPASRIQRAGLNHEVLSRMLEAAERLAPFLQASGDPRATTLCYSPIESVKLAGVEPRADLREATLGAVRNPAPTKLASEFKSTEP